MPVCTGTSWRRYRAFQAWHKSLPLMSVKKCSFSMRAPPFGNPICFAAPKSGLIGFALS